MKKNTEKRAKKTCRGLAAIMLRLEGLKNKHLLLKHPSAEDRDACAEIDAIISRCQSARHEIGTPKQFSLPL